MRLYEIEEQEQHNKDMAKCKELLETSGFENNVELTLDHYRKKKLVLSRGMDPTFFGIRGPRKRISIDGHNIYNLLVDNINERMPPRQHSIIAITDSTYLSDSMYGTKHIIIPKDNTIICNSNVDDVLTKNYQCDVIGNIAGAAGIPRTISTVEDATNGLRDILENETTRRKLLRLLILNRLIPSDTLDNNDVSEVRSIVLDLFTMKTLGWELQSFSEVINTKVDNEVWFDAEAIHIPVPIFKKFIKTL